MLNVAPLCTGQCTEVHKLSCECTLWYLNADHLLSHLTEKSSFIVLSDVFIQEERARHQKLDLTSKDLHKLPTAQRINQLKIQGA